MNNDELKEQINAVVKARDIAQRAKGVVNEARASWEEEHIIWFDTAKDTANAVTEAEVKLRELTLQAYKETGNKAPEVGVGIREVTKLAYDVKEALQWAIDHKMFLKLDVKSFEIMGKSIDIDFVTVSQEPQATIATELKEAIIE